MCFCTFSGDWQLSIAVVLSACSSRMKSCVGLFLAVSADGFTLTVFIFWNWFEWETFGNGKLSGMRQLFTSALDCLSHGHVSLDCQLLIAELGLGLGLCLAVTSTAFLALYALINCCLVYGFVWAFWPFRLNLGSQLLVAYLSMGHHLLYFWVMPP